MHGRRQAVLVQHGDIAGFEKAFEQQYGFVPAQFTAADRLVQIQHGQPLRLLETLDGVGDVMPVGVGLDDRPDRGRQPRRGSGGLVEMTAHGGKIVRKG
ncbi:hypothetical protein FQZ97_816470 [compost metagenome]